MGILDGILGAITSPIASIASGVLGAFGQEQTNQTNQDIAQQNSAFNAEQAQLNREFQLSSNREAMQFAQASAREQMQFQTDMSGTAYQRAVRDLEAAGLNPMLAYSQGGASTPSGSTASGSSSAGSMATAIQPAPMGNPYAAGTAAAQTAAQLNAQYAQTERTNAEAENLRADTQIKKAEMVTNDTPGSFRSANLNAQTEMYGALSREAQKRIEKIAADIGLTTAETQNAKARLKGIKSDSEITAYSVQRAANEGNAQNSWYNRNIAPYLPDFLKSANSAASAARAFK